MSLELEMALTAIGREKRIPHLETEQVREATAHSAALFLVKADGRVVGMIEKYRNTRTEIHPWKAFSGVGMTAQYIGAFYPEDQRFSARSSAIQAVLAAANL
jgi:hypothetical protein